MAEAIDPNAPAGDIHIIPEGRMVTKSTTCANCLHFRAGRDVFMEWVGDKAVRDEIARIRMLVRLTGLQLSGFDEGQAALAVSQMMARGMTQAEAILRLEQQKLEAAKKATAEMGLAPEWADQRMTMHRAAWEGLQTGFMGVCGGKGVDKDDREFHKLSPIMSGYHCHKWTGRDGWSVAHEGRPLDPLPQELVALADEKAVPGKLPPAAKDDAE